MYCWLDGKTVVVTGASGGMGAGIAATLIKKHGCTVIGVARSEPKMLKFIEELGPTYAQQFSYKLFDVSVKENWENFYNELVEEGVQVDVLVSKLKSRFGVDAELSEPRVPYREKIRKAVTVEGKHKKQSGGHGQYGHVKMEFAPYAEGDYLFQEKIFGGSVPKNFHPAVDKGIREAMERGSSSSLRLREPLRVVIAYNTVGVAPDGRVLFHPDIYGHDAALDAALRRGARAAAP